MQKQKAPPHIAFLGESLGTLRFSPQDFPPSVYEVFETEEFKNLETFYKYEKIDQVLFEEIEKQKGEVFLFPHLLSYITKVRSFLPSYHLGSFEFWLNHYSGVSEEKKLEVRGKIVGKYIPRASYQTFFPIGGGEIFPGPHFSLAHYSPDLDTTVASFSCFLAAFGANIAEGRHHWVVPGGPPQGSMEIDLLFKEALGKEIFPITASFHSKLSISTLDLLTQKNIVKKGVEDISFGIDYGRGEKSVLVVDKTGHYLGDWRETDVDDVRVIVTRFLTLLTTLQNEQIHGLISLLSMQDLHQAEVDRYLETSFSRSLIEGCINREITEKAREELDLFIKKVLHIPAGFSLTLREFFRAYEKFGFGVLMRDLDTLTKGDLFDTKGVIKCDRRACLQAIEKLILGAKEAISAFNEYTETLEVALAIKREVLKFSPHYISHLADYDEIVEDLEHYRHMTVNYREGDKLFPMGVIHAASLKKKGIATASWNDFSNPQETDARGDVELISFIDHHKSQVVTGKPVLGIVKDAQSSNSIVATLNFEINDRFSAGGQTMEGVDAQIHALSSNLESAKNRRLLERLLKRKTALLMRGPYYVAYEREVVEYLQYLFAILDDTDLLTKVTEYDIDCMASLVNRLKSLMERKEVEVVAFDDLDRSDPSFKKKAARRLLQTGELYSLYSLTYHAKELALDKLIEETALGKETPFFQDTKVMNGYAEVGQIKHFAKNRPLFVEKSDAIRSIWVTRCEKAHAENPEINLFIFMVSTIYSADELFADRLEEPKYRDELWFWVPEGDKKGAHHLRSFLTDFVKSPKMAKQKLEVEFFGPPSFYESVFKEALQTSFAETKHPHLHGRRSLALLKVDQKSIKSRKSDIAAFL